MRRCAAILEFDQESRKEVYRIIHNPTIGDIRSLRNKGAIILRQIIQRFGNEVHSRWVADNGRTVVIRIDFLKGD